jgi:hypothetical protein
MRYGALVTFGINAVFLIVLTHYLPALLPQVDTAQGFDNMLFVFGLDGKAEMPKPAPPPAARSPAAAPEQRN